MAPQVPNIPWGMLASTLELRPVNPCQNGAFNFHFHNDPDRNRTLTRFRNAFVRNILNHAMFERSLHPQTYSPPGPNDLVLTDDVAISIEKDIHYWRSDHDGPFKFGPIRGLKRHKRLCDCQSTCTCPLPLKERKMLAFQRQGRDRSHPMPCPYSQDQFCFRNRKPFFNLEVIKTLLVHRELDTLLQISAHPSVDLGYFCNRVHCNCVNGKLGWDVIFRVAMDVYIMLNVVYCFRETWEQSSTPVANYTSLKVYQQVVCHCTKYCPLSDIPAYPQPKFFGIPKHQFEPNPLPHNRARWQHLIESEKLRYYPCGLMTYPDFLAFEKPIIYQPRAKDVDFVSKILHKVGRLPIELIDRIFSLADYTTGRRLVVPHLPFHPDNRAELNHHLDQCWQLIVECAVFLRAQQPDTEDLGAETTETRMSDMVESSVQWLFECPCDTHFESASDHSGP
ncbi:hypothetical protein NM208_g2247 [Fusarium decemcellulare]|uniref:Uncharacterized protein n=1 Tax=Fusarium decemcellulare TaxID=57161 RepID=A0ACC1STI1_9HYPO|nr:hypothetical protein NM208_g2247 [Fusarium decemcellulare]